MSSRDHSRAQQDSHYRASLSEAARAWLPSRPAAWTAQGVHGLNRTADLKGLRVHTALRAGWGSDLRNPSF